MANFVAHEPCPECGSKNNLARYDDGSAYCFGCQHSERGQSDPPKTRSKPKEHRVSDLVNGGVCRYLPKRGLTEETCAKFNYRADVDFKGEKVQVANYYKDGAIVAQKLRTKDKDFVVTGDTKAISKLLFGAHLWRDGGGEKSRIIVTEGEIDAMSVSQAQGNKWPVVSVPNGAQGAAKTIAANIEYLEKFSTVVFCFDMDEPGVEAAKECAQLLTPGKAKIAHLPLKDANEMLVAGRAKELIDATWNAKEWRPDGIVAIDEIMGDAEKPIERGLPWCFPELTRWTYGRRWGDLYAFGAGSGIGKTDVLTQQIAYDVTELKQSVGVIYLEQQPTETAKRVAGKVAGRRFHVPDAGWTVEEQRAALKKLSGKVYFYDNFGETDWDVVKAKIRYMHVARGVRLFYLDHLTAMADTANEKESLEQIMKEMAGLAKALGIIIHFVSHLTTPEGKPHEEGGRVMAKHFKGSRAIMFWSYYMFGLERDTQHKDPERRRITTFRCVKDRYTGQANGNTFGLSYDVDTGRLFECPLPSDGEDDNPMAHGRKPAPFKDGGEF